MSESRPAPAEIIDGIACYAPAVARDHADYPESGFEVTVAVEARSFWCRTRNRILKQVFRRFTDNSRQLDVLEIGCGVGGVVGALQELPNLRLTASEIYIQGLKFARKRWPGIEFIQLDATQMPFHGAFDVIGAFDVLEHIEDDELVMRNVHGALRPGGTFVITVPQYQWMWSTLDELVYHKRRYSRDEMVARLKRSGFDPIYTTSFVTLLFPMMAISRLLDRGKNSNDQAEEQFSDRVALPGRLNTVFDWVMRIEESLLRLGVRLPFGGSLLVVARRRPHK